MLRTGYGSLAAMTLALSMSAPFHAGRLEAQLPQFQLSGGLGISFPDSGGQPYGVGAGLVFEYLPSATRWIAPRLYGGVVLSGTRRDSCGLSPCAVSSQIAVAGGKIRLTVPIPVLSPFVELGAGLSAGAITTRYAESTGSGTPFLVDEDHTGVMVHVPLTIGVAFGAYRQHDISVEYYAHPDRDHVASVLSVGIGLGSR